MRIIVADCSAQYTGRLNATLPFAKRVILVKADQSCLIFSELGSYKPLNWMTSPCKLREIEPGHKLYDRFVRQFGFEENSDVKARSEAEANIEAPERAEAETEPAKETEFGKSGKSGKTAECKTAVCKPEKFLRSAADKTNDELLIALYSVYSDSEYDLGTDPGVIKDGVEAHLQKFLAEQIERIGRGAKLVRREYPTAIGPVDIMAVDGQGTHVAIEIKRNGGIDGVEQLTRYCELLNRDPLLAPVRGIFAAQTITAQARVLAHDRGFECLILDYDEMKGTDSDEVTLF